MLLILLTLDKIQGWSRICGGVEERTRLFFPYFYFSLTRQNNDLYGVNRFIGSAFVDEDEEEEDEEDDLEDDDVEGIEDDVAFNRLERERFWSNESYQINGITVDPLFCFVSIYKDEDMRLPIDVNAHKANLVRDTIERFGPENPKKVKKAPMRRLEVVDYVESCNLNFFEQQAVQNFHYEGGVTRHTEAFRYASKPSSFMTDKLYLTVPLSKLLSTILHLKYHSLFNFKRLVHLTRYDQPGKCLRFTTTYFLQNENGTRLLVATQTNELYPIPSRVTLFASADCLERELWDVFGINYLARGERRRLLTDYGFKGHPRRKDFPRTGFKELNYNDAFKAIREYPVELRQQYRLFSFSHDWATFEKNVNFNTSWENTDVAREHEDFSNLFDVSLPWWWSNFAIVPTEALYAENVMIVFEEAEPLTFEIRFDGLDEEYEEFLAEEELVLTEEIEDFEVQTNTGGAEYEVTSGERWGCPTDSDVLQRLSGEDWISIIDDVKGELTVLEAIQKKEDARLADEVEDSDEDEEEEVETELLETETSFYSDWLVQNFGDEFYDV